MTQPNFTTAEKLALVEIMIETLRKRGRQEESWAILKSIAADLRGRLDGAPSVALAEIERRMAAVVRSRREGDSIVGPLIGVAEEIIGRWPVVKQALERFGDEIEEGGA